ncbi:hypothetical protein J4727_03205 [Providencia rettgeri]|uniref:Uncharacterized protein n=1 Tax=Providencia rettgeri TaxID=587 RepID=A0A939NGI0_PRORE|nr:hypothetical protein [Providencia rettgeri]
MNIHKELNQEFHQAITGESGAGSFFIKNSVAENIKNIIILLKKVM